MKRMKYKSLFISGSMDKDTSEDSDSDYEYEFIGIGQLQSVQTDSSQ